MASNNKSQFFSRNGSMLRDKLSKLGERTFDFAVILFVSAESDDGRSSGPEGRGLGSWWRNDVRRWELWILTGSSTRMS